MLKVITKEVRNGTRWVNSVSLEDTEEVGEPWTGTLNLVFDYEKGSLRWRGPFGFNSSAKAIEREWLDLSRAIRECTRPSYWDDDECILREGPATPEEEALRARLEALSTKKVVDGIIQ